MEEKVLIRSELYSIKECLAPIRIILWILVGVFSLLQLLWRNLGGILGVIIVGAFVYLVISLLFRLIYNIFIKKCEMLVADTSVCWSGPFGVSSCLPLDMISSIKAQKFLGINAVSVSTPSMRISFGFFKNSEEIYRVLAEQLYLRQNNK